MKEKLSYVEAVGLAGQEKNIGNKEPGKVDEQQGKRNARIKKKKLVTCIAGVINVMFEVKKEQWLCKEQNIVWIWQAWSGRM